MICQSCGREMYREDWGGQETWWCPVRLDGTHGEWHSMAVTITRVSDEEFEHVLALTK
jgi:hypothetical protein